MTAQSVVPSPLAALTPQGVAGLPAPLLKVKATTPRVLVFFRWLVWATVLILFVAAESTLSTSRSAFKTIGSDAAPSIIAAQEIGYALADLDANVANSLLGTPQHRQAAAAAIEKQRIKVTDGLVDAAENITFGDAEKVPIRMLVRGLGVYLEKAALASYQYDHGDAAGARATYWEATDLLHTTLLPQVSDLDQANKNELDKAFAQERKVNDGAEEGAIVLGLLVLGALVALQLYLFRKTRRVFSVALVAATLVSVSFTGCLVSQFNSARQDLRLAKEDAFDSIHALVRARSVADDANGDESRFLLDVDHTHNYDAMFRQKVLLLTNQPTLSAAVANELSAFSNMRGINHRRPKYTGLLWDEVGNITFDGEYPAAARAIRAFADYYGVDVSIRSKAAAGKRAEAIELAIGDRPDESNAAFDRFDGGLQAALDINRAAFDKAIGRGRSDLKSAEVWSPACAIFIALLVWLGLRPRLAEYRA